MTSSEIEVVSSETGARPQRSPNGEAPTVIDVYPASAYGDFYKLRKFVEQDGASLCQPDGNGYYALQSAALSNFADIAQYIIEHGCDVNATDKMLQTALHWGAVRGSITAADVLLQNGGRVEETDAVHVAAQYGQTAFLNHLVAKYHAGFDAPDNEGRSPLHSAAYKGYADTIRLLLFRDASQGRHDKEGCTPLHWAALRGKVEACTVLVHASTKQELTVKDKAGFTPVQLVNDKGHRSVAPFLSNAAQRAQGKQWIDKICRVKMADTGYAPILLTIIIILMFLFVNSVIAAPNLPNVTAVVGIWGWIALSLAVVSMIMFYRCSSKDPGFIKRLVDLGRDGDTERNKRDFLFFVCLGTLTSFLAAVITVQRIWTAVHLLHAEERWIHYVVVQHPSTVAFLALDIFILLAATTLTIAQISQIARNITTNELANAVRYGYLQGPDGHFRNPYNHGCRKNCADFLIQGYTDDEDIAWAPLQQIVN